jgi:transposase-like protein
MEIMDALALTRRSVEDADLPEPWGEIAFREILHSLLRSQAPDDAMDSRTLRTGLPASEAGSSLARLAARMGVAEDALADVFGVEDDAVTLHVASGRIPATKSRATREVALLTVAARQGAGIDESWTDIDYIRDTLSQYNRYDMSNFSKYLRDTGDVFNFKGKPVQHLRLTRQGWEAATELIRALTHSPG